MRLTRIAIMIMLGIVTLACIACGGPSVSQIAFTTYPQIIGTNNVSNIITIQTLDSRGNPCNVKRDTTISLTSTSTTGRFDNGTITSVSIPKGSNLANFYYSDTTYGTPIITAAEFPSQNWSDGTQQETVIWVGPDGEAENENISCGANCYVEGGDGHTIELVNNPAAKDPMWYQLESFLQEDNTDHQLYVNDSFVCTDFAETLHNNAEKSGIRAAYVIIVLDNVSFWALNAFNTTDRGLVYIDDTGLLSPHLCSVDTIVSVSVGEQYVPHWIVPCPGYWPMWKSMGVVTYVSIQW